MAELDRDRYLKIQTGAVRAGQAAADQIARWRAAGADRLVFSGTGGAAILMEPAANWLQQQGAAAAHVSAADAMALDDARIGKGAIVVVPSLSGTTKESVGFCDWARARGAQVLALCGHAGTPVADGADHAVINFAEDDTSSESFYIQSLMIASVWARSPIEMTENTLSALPDALLCAKTEIAPHLEDWANFLNGPGPFLFCGAAATWPEAHYFAMCILEEMQWIPTRPIAAAPFFHGTLELLEKDTPLIIFHGEDGGRGLTERVAAFAGGITGRMRILDSRNASLPGIAPDLRPLLAPVVLACWLERISDRLAEMRNHPLTTRRYYRRMAY